MGQKEKARVISSPPRPGAKDIQDLRVWHFFDPNSPWVLVHEGSLMGVFDFVPKHLRVGPWTALAPVYISIMVAKLIYWMPQRSTFHLDDEMLSAHPIAYSEFWFYNIITMFWMKLVLAASLRRRGPGILATFTIQSWITIMIRHGLSALAPFLPRKHFLLCLNELLRFPALATASITFFYWNFILAPLIYCNFKTPEKKLDFLKFNFNFRMIQVHFFNIIFAIMNTIVTSHRPFQFIDLWCGLAGSIGYSLMYLLVLDRIGVHLYPIFSPRTKWSLLSWTALMGTYVVVYIFWNRIISSGRLSISFNE